MESTEQFPIHQAKVKRCNRCGEEKALPEFIQQSSLRDGYSNLCKACRREGDRSRYTYEKGRKSYFKYKYGITLEEYEERLAAQDGKCAICGATDSGQDTNNMRGRLLHVDHDHQTGEIRSLLCSNCNRGVGCFRDDPEILSAAIEYLQAEALAS